MAAEPLDTPNAPPTAGPYSPAVRAGDLVVLSGQVGFDPSARALADGVAAQTTQVMANLEAVLGDCGGTWADVVKTTVYVTDISDFATVNEAYGAALGAHRPARATVQVAALPMGAQVEVEAWAHLPI